MFKFLLIACERGGGAWPPVAALCDALVHEGHSVTVLCDKLIKDSFIGADILLVPDDCSIEPISISGGQVQRPARAKLIGDD